MESSTDPEAKNFSTAWRLAIPLAVLSGLATFWLNGGRDAIVLMEKLTFFQGYGKLLGGMFAAALNPLVWLGLFAIEFRCNHFACPHCGESFNRSVMFSDTAVGGRCKCGKCGHVFIKPAAP